MMNATVWVTFEAIDKIEYFVVHDMLTGEKKKMKASDFLGTVFKMPSSFNYKLKNSFPHKRRVVYSAPAFEAVTRLVNFNRVDS